METAKQETKADPKRKAAQANTVTQPDEEIGAPANGGAAVTVTSFSKRLRSALEAMKDGQHIDIRTQAERQQVSNIVGQVQKKLNVKYETVVLRKRSDDAEGKIAIRINRLGPLPAKQETAQ